MMSRCSLFSVRLRESAPLTNGIVDEEEAESGAIILSDFDDALPLEASISLFGPLKQMTD